MLLSLKLWVRRKKAAAPDVTLSTQPTIPDIPTIWEWLLEGLDNYCCIPLLLGADDNSDAKSETPSEIYICVDSSKNLYTI